MPTPPNSSEGEAPTIPSFPDGGLPPELEDHLDDALQDGDEVGEYVISGMLGEGGFGTVYEANHPLIGKKAAIKVLSREFSSNRDMVSRFVAEARAVNTIRHANIIDVFSFGTLEDGRHYFVMELLDGATLDRFVKEDGPMEPALAVQVLRGVARALDAAHKKGIVHRDLKPENIFLTFDEDGHPVPKLLDFGIAKLSGEAKASSSHKTRTGTPIGTPQYMSPEQCIGEPADERSDVYALGIVAFELLTGESPFTGDNMLAIMNQQTTADRPLVSGANAQLGTCFDDAICTMMAIDAEERPATPGEAWRQIAEAAKEGGFDVETPRSLPAERRHPVATLASAATQPVDSIGTDTRPPSTRTIGGDDTSSSGGRTALWVGALALVGVGVYVGLTDPGGVAAEVPTAKPRAVPTSPSSAVPNKSNSAVPVTKKVSITVSTTAASATVFLDGRELGPAPGTFAVDAADGERELSVTAPGHDTAKKRIALSDGLRVDLEPAPRKPAPANTAKPGPAAIKPTRPAPGGKTHGDLEDPYR